ncbi:thiamine pyrophosphate-dependent enzyme [Candidatus Eisenbacteria bacterium]|uniref:Thiamine pyrophosphate-dependent enzyme n=1 Tax=Eiseniibacteriota bacterium TaxID=2212470 RepID=A0ABV6YIC7_UNCEI
MKKQPAETKAQPAGNSPEALAADTHPKDRLLRADRLPHIWCPTCGIGTCVAAFVEAIEETGIPEEKFAVVSGIGCTGRVAGYVKLDSFHTTHGRAIPFATGLHLANPELKTIVFSGDGDLVAIGGNHLIHAARRNIDITVICVNNFIYGMTGGQLAPTTPQNARTTTSPYGAAEHPFNVPHLVASCGASYVARWTALHVRRMKRAFVEAINKHGFSFVEVIAPCSTLYARKNRLGSGYDLMKFYHDHCEVEHGADTKELDIGFQTDIAVGKFVDIEKPTFLDRTNEIMAARHG